VTLELALSGVPMVTTYVADGAQWRRVSKYKMRFASLPNILVGSELVPEFLGTKLRTPEVIGELERLLDNPAEMERQRDGFRRIRAGMEKGAPEAPLVDPSERVLAHLQRLSTGT
jgi:lipid-A-disaccharide synthase